MIDRHRIQTLSNRITCLPHHISQFSNRDPSAIEKSSLQQAAGVLANNDACRLVVAVALTQSVIVPAQKTTNLVGVVSGQRDLSFTTEAISSKILSRYSFSSSKE